MRVCLMIEGQEGVEWQEWVDIARSCERHGFDALFRSDHYLSIEQPPVRGSLDAWGTISALAAVTERIGLGTLVSPVTFRHPSALAKAAVTADHVSGGRVELGIGAGWYEAEHEAYGFLFPDAVTRVEQLGEQLDARPRPIRPPNLIVGGRGRRMSVAHAARWADEYNTVYAGPDRCRGLRRTLEEAWAHAGREGGELTFSLMTGVLVGADREEVRERAGLLAEWSGEDVGPAELIERLAGEWVIGTVAEAIERLRALAAAGVDRVMLQHNVFRDREMIELIGTEVIPAVS